MEVNLIPKWVKDFSQIHRGDVTIVPSVGFEDYVSVYHQPTDDFVQYWFFFPSSKIKNK